MFAQKSCMATMLPVALTVSNTALAWIPVVHFDATWILIRSADTIAPDLLSSTVPDDDDDDDDDSTSDKGSPLRSASLGDPSKLRTNPPTYPESLGQKPAQKIGSVGQETCM